MIRISVIMSVFNGAEYVDQAVESILNQTFHDFEFIIVDDGSTDNTIEIIDKYEDPRIKVIRNVNNYGLPKSLNIGIGLSKGLYIARQDADDISDKYRLEKQFQYAENTVADLVGSDSVNIDVNGDFISVSTFNDFDNVDLRSIYLRRNMLFAHGSAFIRRESLLEVGLYNEGFFYAQDAELWMRFINNNKLIHYIHEPLYYLRRLPIKNDKKAVGQKMYMDCLKQYHFNSRGGQNITNFEHEIDHINQFLSTRNVKVFPNYKGDYWHYCSTTSLIEARDRRMAFKYLIKAFTEKMDIWLFLSHLKVLTAFFLPLDCMKRMLKRK